MNTTHSAAILHHIARRFRVLGETSRLAIMSVLRDGERSVSDLVDETGLGQANVSKHLQLLHHHGFVERRKDGLNVLYRLADDDVFRICDLVCGRLERETREMGGLLGMDGTR